MGGNMYETPLPVELVTLPKLERLYVDNTFITSNMTFIASMPVIFELWIDSNPISSSIPTEIGTVSTLGEFTTTIVTFCLILRS